MPSITKLLLALPALSLAGQALGSAAIKRQTDPRSCQKSENDNPAFMIICIKTVVFAIEAMTNASNNFIQACEDLDYATAYRENLDIPFLRLEVCGNFDGQGIKYNDAYLTIAKLSLAQDAVAAAEFDNTDPALSIVCDEIDLDVLDLFKLPSSSIRNAACAGLFLPTPTPTPTPYPGPTNATTSDNCSSTAYAASPTPKPRLLRKRAEGTVVERINRYIKFLESVLFAIQLILTDSDLGPWCSAFWLNAFNGMGLDGDYVEAFVCAYSAGDILFDGQTIEQARQNLFIALRGLTLARDDPTSPARAVDCDFLDLRTLLQAELDGRDIVRIVCPYYNTSSGSSSSSTSSSMAPNTTVSLTSTSSVTISGTGITITGTGTGIGTGTGLPTCLSGSGNASGGFGCDTTTSYSWNGPSYHTQPTYTPPTYTPPPY